MSKDNHPMSYTFIDTDENILTHWIKAHSSSAEITRIPSDHSASPMFESFLTALTEKIPQLTFKNESDEKDLPALMVNENITFSAIPQGKILTSFLSCLFQTASTPSALSSKTLAHLNKIDIPVLLKLYIANTCPHCPGVLETVLSLAAASPRIHLTVIDGTLFPDAAAKEGVMSAPCLILDDFRWTGSVTAEEIAAMMVDRDPSLLSTASLRMILEEGKAEWIAEKILDRNKIFPGFIGLVTHPIWSVRLGAMVVIEELSENAPDLARQIVPNLLDAFEKADIPTKGDILYALGEVGDGAVRETISGMMDALENADLKEAAQEAIESIEERS